MKQRVSSFDTRKRVPGIASKEQENRNASRFTLHAQELKVVIKGAGEMASGIATRLYMANITRIVMTEIPEPITVRRTVAFSEAVYDGKCTVEGVTADLVKGIDDILAAWEKNNIAVIVDPEWKIVAELAPDVVVDAIMAKRNTGSRREEAPLVIGVGPGFSAPHNVHVVVESNRGHNLGRVFYNGAAESHTGIPGDVMGYSTERVFRAPHEGLVKHARGICERVKQGEIVMYVDKTPLLAPFDGMIRGLIREIHVKANEKIGDIDPRGIEEQCHTISEKARAIGGGVLEAIMHCTSKPWTALP